MEDNQPSRQLALLEPETTAGNQPRVYKSPSSPRPLQSNQLPGLQKLLEPETTPLVCVLWLGRCEESTQKHCCLRTLRGGSPQSPHQPLGPPSRAPVQRESRTVRPISLAFLGVQQTVGRQSHPRDFPWIAQRQAPGVSTPY